MAVLSQKIASLVATLWTLRWGKTPIHRWPETAKVNKEMLARRDIFLYRIYRIDRIVGEVCHINRGGEYPLTAVAEVALHCVASTTGAN